MNKKAKLLKKLYSNPKDFTFVDAKTLLEFLDYKTDNKGKTSGSRIMFKKGNTKIYLHKPHPRKELLSYQVKELQKKLEEDRKDE